MRKTMITSVIALLLIIAAALFLVFGWPGFGKLDPEYQASQNPQNFVTYTIYQGDTLWSIAEMYAPADMDLREYIYILEQNNPDVLQPKSNLIPGEKILIFRLPVNEEVSTNA